MVRTVPGRNGSGRVGPARRGRDGIAGMTVDDVARSGQVPESAGIDPDELATCLRVFEALEALPTEHPDAVASGGPPRSCTRRQAAPARRAAGRGPRGRRRRDRGHRHRRAGPDRRRDPGHPARRRRHRRHRRHAAPGRGPATSASSATREVDAFYHQLCPACAAIEPGAAGRPHRPDRPAGAADRRPRQDRHVHRAAAAAGRRHTTITTRFPNDAVRRFTAMPDSADWLHRLRVVGIDLRDPAQVIALADSVAAAGPARHPDQQRGADRAPLPRRVRAPGRRRIGGRCRTARCRSCVTFDQRRQPRGDRRRQPDRPARRCRPHALTALALTAGSASPERIAAGHRDRRRRPGPRPRPGQQLDPAGARGRPARAARGAAVQHDRAVHPGQPAAAGDGRRAGPAQVRRQRLGDGGPVRPRLQGAGPPAHQHGQGRAEHADPHQRRGDARPTAS